MTKLKIAAALFGLSAAALAAAPTSAAPIASNSVALKAAVAGDVVTVAAKKSKKVYRGGYYNNGNGVAPWWGGPDTVGSLGFDGQYYAYNRFSGQRYNSCMLDLGYGRVRPCDAGSR